MSVYKLLHMYRQADSLPVLVHGCHTTIQLASIMEINALVGEGSTYTDACLQLSQFMLDGLETIQYNYHTKNTGIS